MPEWAGRSARGAAQRGTRPSVVWAPTARRRAPGGMSLETGRQTPVRTRKAPDEPVLVSSGIPAAVLYLGDVTRESPGPGGGAEGPPRAGRRRGYLAEEHVWKLRSWPSGKMQPASQSLKVLQNNSFVTVPLHHRQAGSGAGRGPLEFGRDRGNASVLPWMRV